MKRMFFYVFVFLLMHGVHAVFGQELKVANYAEDYEKVSEDGAWCWFSDPRAIYVRDVMIGGYVDKQGSIVAFSYCPKTGEQKKYKLFDRLDYDDHANPSFMKLPDDRIVIFFSGHGGTTNTPIYYAVSKRPADISAWEELQKVSPRIKGPMGYCYSNAAMLSAENNRIYLFFRGPDFKPDFIWTDDLVHWSEPGTLVKDDTTKVFVRPYMKVTNNGKDKIFFAFTDDHPRNRPTNSIYFMMYKGGKLYGADGRELAEMGKGAVAPKHCDKVYDATKTYEKAWIWDIAFDRDENPVIVYARFGAVKGEHSYWYAKWDGKQWKNSLITKAGQWFQRNDYDKNNIEYECNYSGGVYLDHENPDIVYTSRPIENVFEIERWQRDARGKWQAEAITERSVRDNVRPFVVRGHQAGQPELLWMYNYKYPGFRAYDCAIRVNRKARGMNPAMTKEAVRKAACKVADWQMANLGDVGSNRLRSWVYGPLYMGMFDWAEQSGEKRYLDWLLKIGNREYWQVGNRMYHADDICVGQAFLDMYAKYGKKGMLEPTKARIDWVLSQKPGPGQWSWCDALFMAPGVYSRLYALTKDRKYIKYCEGEYRNAWKQLYDRQEHLFYRDKRYLDKKEQNGQKMFWARGNGWVVAGLAEVLKSLPKDKGSRTDFYEQLLVEMCGRLAGLQCADGTWHASLLDPETYPAPETSGTALIVYAMAYGIHQGLLPREKFLPVVEKGWAALVTAVDTEGRLGWVQPVGDSPKQIAKENTAVYGTGAFLMAATEVYRLVE